MFPAIFSAMLPLFIDVVQKLTKARDWETLNHEQKTRRLMTAILGAKPSELPKLIRHIQRILPSYLTAEPIVRNNNIHGIIIYHTLGNCVVFPKEGEPTLENQFFERIQDAQ